MKKNPVWICKDLYTNKLYSATINVSCKVLAPGNKISYKPFKVYFELQEGTKSKYELSVVNSHNFYFYTVAERQIKEEFSSMVYQCKYDI